MLRLRKWGIGMTDTRRGDTVYIIEGRSWTRDGAEARARRRNRELREDVPDSPYLWVMVRYWEEYDKIRRENNAGFYRWTAARKGTLEELRRAGWLK